MNTTLPTILVADDDVIIADTLVEILNEHGFAATAVYGGVEAIRKAKETCPLIVLTDVLMPDATGIDVAVAVRETCSNTRVVLFSGQAGTSELLEQARSRGYDFELLPKPIHPTLLLKTLRTPPG
jgi:CheY-like chemotaxis protein